MSGACIVPSSVSGPRSTTLRRILDANLYVNRTGCQWGYLPHDFPPYQTVYYYYAAWEKEGVTEAVHEALRVKRHLRAKRSPRPRGRPVCPLAVLSANRIQHGYPIRLPPCERINELGYRRSLIRRAGPTRTGPGRQARAVATHRKSAPMV